MLLRSGFVVVMHLCLQPVRARARCQNTLLKLKIKRGAQLLFNVKLIAMEKVCSSNEVCYLALFFFSPRYSFPA